MRSFRTGKAGSLFENGERGRGRGTSRCNTGRPCAERTSPLSLLPFLVGSLLAAAMPAWGQVPSPAQAQSALQQAVSQNPGLPDVIRQRLLQSGLTPEQVRARLQASGYPSNLLDSYLGGGA